MTLGMTPSQGYGKVSATRNPGFHPGLSNDARTGLRRSPYPIAQKAGRSSKREFREKPHLGIITDCAARRWSPITYRAWIDKSPPWFGANDCLRS